MGDKRTLPQLLSLIELKTQFSLVYIDVWEPSIVLLFDFLITSFLLLIFGKIFIVVLFII